MKISVIIPIYNVEKYLSKCLESVLRQTFTKLEIILVDDGSTDHSGKMCDEYALRDSRIKVIHKENGGLVSARQAGIGIATGDYIGFVDSDDWIEQDMYQTLYDAAVLENADIVAEGAIDDFEGRCMVSLNQLSAGTYGTSDKRNDLYAKMLCCRDFFSLGIQPYLWNKLFRRELVVQHMNKIPCAIRVGEDAAAVYPMLAMAERIVLLDIVQYHYCHHKDSMMLAERDEEQEFENAMQLNAFLKEAFEDLGVYDVMESQLNRYMVNNLMVRAYNRVAGMDTNTVLFPFSGISEGDSVVIYGAGALGRAVYQYAINCGKLAVRALVDRNAENYKVTGLDVCQMERIDIADSDKIIVAVFARDSYYAIRRTLLDRGILLRQIIWIDDLVDKIRDIFGQEYDSDSSKKNDLGETYVG